MKLIILSRVPLTKETLPKTSRVSVLMPEGKGHCVGCKIEAKFVITYTTEGVSGDVTYTGIFAAPYVSRKKMMTADHILPRSIGGRDSITNLQIMCGKCNNDKSNILSPEDSALIKANLSNHIRPTFTIGNMKAVCRRYPELMDMFGLTGEEPEPERPYKTPKRKPFGVFIPRMNKIQQETFGLVNNNHPHHPGLGWYRILKQFPQLHSLVSFKNPALR